MYKSVTASEVTTEGGIEMRLLLLLLLLLTIVAKLVLCPLATNLRWMVDILPLPYCKTDKETGVITTVLCLAMQSDAW